MGEYEATVPTKDIPALRRWGGEHLKLFETYKKNRRPFEDACLKSLRQFKGIYDPSVTLASTRSTAYPKITRYFVIAYVARLMSMLFPSEERHWEIGPSPIPYLERDVSKAVIDKVYVGAADPSTVTEEQIMKAFETEAKRRGANMQKLMDDQLSEMDYVTIARKIIGSAVLYGAGILKGPLTRVERRTVLSKNPTSRRFEAKDMEVKIPYFEHLPTWSYYPDLLAKEHTPKHMDGHFERHLLTHAGVLELTEQDGFLNDEITEYLRQHPTGNYKEEWWETEIRAIDRSDRQQISPMSGSKYELHVWWGTATGAQLKAAGVPVEEGKEHRAYEANVWGIGDRIVKVTLSPLSSERMKRLVRPAHAFIFEEDDVSLLGGSLPQTLRDSQLTICEAVRAMLDNVSIVCGPNLVVDKMVLGAETTDAIHAFKVWYVDSSKMTNAGQRPVYELNFNSHLPELQAIVGMFMEFAEKEASLPPSLMGDLSNSKSEPFRTSSGAAALLAAQALPIKDTVRNFDRFTESVMYSLYFWNMEFGTDPETKGDFTIIPKGSSSLIAKEIRAAALDYLATTLTDDERVYVDAEKMLQQRAAARDVPFDSIRATDDEVASRIKQREQAGADAARQSEEQVSAMVKKTLADAFKAIQLGRKAAVDANVNSFESLVEGMVNALTAAGGGAPGATGGGADAGSAARAASEATA